MGKLIYELPEDINKVAKIVEAIPSDWYTLNGVLFATRELYEKGQVAKNLSLVVSGSEPRRPYIVGRCDDPQKWWTEVKEISRECECMPEIADIALRNKLFSSVHFDKIGCEAYSYHPGYICNIFPLLSPMKELAAGLIRVGYDGYLSASNAYHTNYGYVMPDEFCLKYFHDVDYAGRLEGLQYYSRQSRITLEWYNACGGRKEDFDEIVNVFDSLGLKAKKMIVQSDEID